MTLEKPSDQPFPTWDECMEILDGLPALPLEERAAVIEKLLRNPSPEVRDQALRVGMAVLDDATLVRYLRNDADAVLRNAGCEILKERGGRSFKLAVDLLKDDDPEVVLQAVLVLDGIKDPRAFEPLRAVLNHEDPNVAQAGIVAIGHLGDARAVPDLLPFLQAETWFQAAAVEALGDLRSAAAISHLDHLLTDLFLGPLAAEAMAQIGGGRALRLLSHHWLRFREELDPETGLGLLAHILEGLPRQPKPIEGLRAAMAEHLRDPFQGVRSSAARCLLALGPGPEDGEALAIVAGDRVEPRVLPSCLARRSDLIDELLSKTGAPRSWGFLLASRFPRSVDPGAVAEVLLEDEPIEVLAPVVGALSKLRGPDLAAPILHFFFSLSPERRAILVPVLRAHKKYLQAVLDEDGVSPRDRVLVHAAMGSPPTGVCEDLLALSESERIEVLEQLADRPDVVSRLPWREWLSESPEVYGDLAGRVAAQARLSDLLPVLRPLLAPGASSEVVRAVGSLGDRESVPRLLELLDAKDPGVRPVAVESLGKIGGPEARGALRDLAARNEPLISRMAYRALAACATEEDDEFFRMAAAHPDWYVRQASVDVLGRFARPENRRTLAQLAADPVPLVSQRAMTLLEG